MGYVSKYSTIKVAVYRGEDLLHSGKINDVAKAMGVQARTVYFYLMPTYQRRIASRKSNPDRVILVVRL